MLISKLLRLDEMVLGTNWKLVKLINYVGLLNVGLYIVNTFNWFMWYYFTNMLHYNYPVQGDLETYVIVMSIAFFMIVIMGMFWRPYKFIDVYLIVAYTLMYTMATCNVLIFITLLRTMLLW